MVLRHCKGRGVWKELAGYELYDRGGCPHDKSSLQVVCPLGLTWVVSQGGKSPQHILDALRSELAQLVHQLTLQHLEQHGAGVVVQGGKCPQRVGDVLTVEVLQPLHGL